MMSQVVNTETFSSGENLHRDASQQQSASYVPTTMSESWDMHKVDYSSTENGGYSNPTYQYDQHSLPPPPPLPSVRGAQDSLTSALTAGCSASSGTANVAQESSAYTAYPGSSNPYGYSSTGYSSYYGSYQQQPNHSYSQPVGAYQNTGAPYQPISSFQNTGSYAGSTTYSSTYYNPDDYQSTGGYQGSSYGNSTTFWNNGNYSNYSSHQYTSYTPDATGAYNTGTAAPPSLQYQQHYKQWADKQWADYYSQTEVSCAPGTENMSVATTSHVNCPVPGVTINHAAPNNQPQPTYAPYTPSWRQEPSLSNTPPAQPATIVSGAYDGYWQQGPQTFQNHHPSTIQPNFQKPLDLKTHDSFHDQSKIASSEVPNFQYSTTQQVPQINQPTLQTTPVDSQRMNKLQIPTNPRIASNFTLGLSKTDKDSSTSSAAAKPAYISVAMPKSNEKVLPTEAANSIFKPGTFPKSLRGYVERALARCKDDTQMAACQASLKEVITKATDDGTLFTRNWDIEPLFAIPPEDVVNRDSQSSLDDSSLLKYKRSPYKRSKSRWEPLPEEKPADKSVSVRTDTAKYSGWLHINEKDKKLSVENTELKDDTWRNSKFSSPIPTSIIKGPQRTFKRQRIAEGFNETSNGDGSSDSDKEQSLASYYSGAMALSDSPEERKRRENRSKRFERGQGRQLEHNIFRPKNAGAGNLYARRTTALVLSKNFEDVGNRAVEDIDWDALTVKGTCQEIEKRYLRLTSAPDPSTVRPEEVLGKALFMVQNSPKNYLFKCDQLKSIRQDLTVQRIHNQLTVMVYETHARLALEFGDLPEYNQCQSQLKTLYAEGIEGCHMEFAAYNLLYILLHTNNYRELLSSMSRLSDEAKEDAAVKHALAVRAAVTMGNYVTYFRLYKTAPNLNTYLMDLYVEKMRFKAITCMCRSYRPTIPVSYISQVLGFSRNMAANEGIDEKETDALEECIEWLKAHGASVVADNNGDMSLDTKASTSCLYVPEPDDAVAHGDANLALNDFFARTPL